MAEGLIEIVGNLALLTMYGVNALVEAKKKSKSEKETAGRSLSRKAFLSSSSVNQYPRATLITSSSASFGNDCERLVNIAFHTSQTFPSMMGSCADIDEYLRKELTKLYPDEYFQIITGDNQAFGFSVDGGQHFAEIQQDRYRVLIFSTKRDPRKKLDTHDANSQMTLKWN